jgi:hypothetical protein
MPRRDPSIEIRDERDLRDGAPIESQRKFIFDALIAFCVAASGTFLGGTAIASGKIPIVKGPPIQFSAAGGIGIFIVVLLLMHYVS